MRTLTALTNRETRSRGEICRQPRRARPLELCETPAADVKERLSLLTVAGRTQRLRRNNDSSTLRANQVLAAGRDDEDAFLAEYALISRLGRIVRCGHREYIIDRNRG